MLSAAKRLRGKAFMSFCKAEVMSFLFYGIFEETSEKKY
jgi:hypothetical protein